jgi:hypothetical protein
LRCKLHFVMTIASIATLRLASSSSLAVAISLAPVCLCRWSNLRLINPIRLSP